MCSCERELTTQRETNQRESEEVQGTRVDEQRRTSLQQRQTVLIAGAPSLLEANVRGRLRPLVAEPRSGGPSLKQSCAARALPIRSLLFSLLCACERAQPCRTHPERLSPPLPRTDAAIHVRSPHASFLRRRSSSSSSCKSRLNPLTSLSQGNSIPPRTLTRISKQAKNSKVPFPSFHSVGEPRGKFSLALSPHRPASGPLR